MQDDLIKTNLSQIETSWSLLIQAHEVEGDATSTARCALMVRYAGAVQRYLLCVTRDPDLAAELGQEFALRFLRGDFRHADPRRGRFRSYVKSSIRNLLADFRRQQRKQPQTLTVEVQENLDSPQDSLDADRQFLDCWRDEILSRAWERLASHQNRTHQPYYTVLRFRAEHPEMRSQEISERLASQLGKPLTAGWVRQNLRRARERFVEFVQIEVAYSLGNPSEEEREDELRNLNLWDYCTKKESSL
jgi:RNA polymerase sigma factor (sigma-70 family)